MRWYCCWSLHCTKVTWKKLALKSWKSNVSVVNNGLSFWFWFSDLSKNRLCELPEELCQFISLETLSLYHNGMRSLSSSLGNLQALTYLNLRYLHSTTSHINHKLFCTTFGQAIRGSSILNRKHYNVKNEGYVLSRLSASSHNVITGIWEQSQ